MRKIKKLWQTTGCKLLIAALLLATTIFYPPRSVIADNSFRSIKDTIGNAGSGVTGVTHVIVASTTQAVVSGGYLEVVFTNDFTVVATTSLVCPGAGIGHGSGNDLKCVYAAGLTATNTVITVSNVNNPSDVGSYSFHAYNKQGDGTIQEKATFRVAIVENVLVTASVETSLAFTISGLATSSVINGVATTGSSTTRTLDFGILDANFKKTLGQRISVGTNATHGFTVTVAQNHNLLSSGGADIDSFKDGAAASTTPLAWASPSPILGQESTYGHFGITSQDSTFSGGTNPYNVGGVAKYRGFWGTAPVEVLYNSGPADGVTDDIGSTSVAYSIEISPVQESGDYSNTLTYVCTPTF